MHLQYEPASETLHIFVKQLFIRPIMNEAEPNLENESVTSGEKMT